MIVKIGRTKETLKKLLKSPLLEDIPVSEDFKILRKDSRENDRFFALHGQQKTDFRLSYQNLKDYQDSDISQFVNTYHDVEVVIQSEDGKVMYSGRYYVLRDGYKRGQHNYRKAYTIEFIQV